MFTGLVQQVGRIASTQAEPEGRRLRVAAKFDLVQRADGASICVSGACLTVIDSDEEGFWVQAAFETLDKTSLGGVGVGDPVNLEPSLRVGDPIGGHLVTGHVDGLATLERITPRGESMQMWFRVAPHLAAYVAAKGSVCLDGVSLTVNEVDGASFSVGVIPHTLSVTTLGQRRAGDAVNLEVDLLARYVARLLAVGDHGGSGLTRDHLHKAGFLPGHE